MEIIGAGLPRTGTSSLKAALDRLGFGPTYHMFELMQNPDHKERWRPVMHREPADWETVFAGYRSAVDFPASIYWEEMAEAYPEAKVILSVRDPRRWHKSISTMSQEEQDGTFDEMPGLLRPFFEVMQWMEPEMKRMLGDDFGLRDGMDEQTAVDVFERHVAKVRATVPAERLLVFQATDGWGPLCEFLGVDAPTDEPYPHLNDAATLQRIISDAATKSELTSPFEPAS